MGTTTTPSLLTDRAAKATAASPTWKRSQRAHKYFSLPVTQPGGQLRRLLTGMATPIEVPHANAARAEPAWTGSQATTTKPWPLSNVSWSQFWVEFLRTDALTVACFAHSEMPLDFRSSFRRVNPNEIP